MPKKKAIKRKKKAYARDYVASGWENSIQKTMRDWVIPYITNLKQPTKAQIAKLEKERLARERKEAKRRAKKITMTVGELEDKIEEAESRWRDDY